MHPVGVLGTEVVQTPLYTTAPESLNIVAGSAPPYTIAGGNGPYTVSTSNPGVATASIAAQESRFKADTVVRNTNGSVDRGMTGINSIHLPELAKYGITAGDLMDSCKSVYLAGWHLRKKVRKFGNTWMAVGAYHSETPRYRDRYAASIRKIIDFWIAKGILPR